MSFNLFKKYPFITPVRLGATIVVIILVAVVLARSFGSEAIVTEETDTPRVVTFESITELSAEESSLSVLGTVSSRSQAILLAEAQGRITKVNTTLGAFVNAGTILAELDNARERAQVVQARGAYDAAKANFTKISTGARQEQVDILTISAASATQDVESAKVGAVNALLTAYAAIDEAVTKKTDSNFDNPNSQNPVFLVSTGSTRAADEAANRRVALQQVLELNSATAQTLSPETDFMAEISRTEQDLREVRTYLDTVAEALNRGIESSSVSAALIASRKADASLARSSINASLSALSGARDTLNARTAALAIAKKNLQLGETGGQSEDILAAEGNLRSVEGALLAANANFEKTVIRAPISGTVNALAAKAGEFATPGKALVTIANNDALEIIANVTEKERIYLQAGTKVMIDGTTEGVVTAISPALDPVTKKVEVRISIPTDTGVTLTNGKTVRILIPQASKERGVLRIPVTALKITPDGTFVFGVSQEDTIVAIPVEIGQLRGASVEILTPLDSALRIITDVRGLKEGQPVETN